MSNAHVYFLLIILTFSVLHADYETKSGDVSGEIWGEGTYYVTDHLSVVSGDSLVIEPGAVIKFESNVQLMSYGKIKAIGVEGGQIVFTSKNDDSAGENVVGSTGNPQAGDWRGIYIYGYSSNTGAGEFDYCRIRFGGNTGSNFDANLRMFYANPGYFNHGLSEYSASDGLMIAGESAEVIGSTIQNNAAKGINSDAGNLTISDCEVLDNVDTGIYTHNSVIELTNSVLSGNGGYPFQADGSDIGVVSGISGSGNLYDLVNLRGTITEDQEFSAATYGFPILINGNLNQQADKVMTIPAGEIIKFDEDALLGFYGTVTIAGTESEEVIFTSLKDDNYGGDWNNDGDATQPSAGDYKGIMVNGNSTNQGIMEMSYCRMLYGGSNAAGNPAVLYLYYVDSTQITNCVIENSFTDGIHTLGGTFTISGCDLINNAEYGLDNNGSECSITGCEITDNGLDGINSNTGSIEIENNVLSNNGGYAAVVHSGITNFANNSGTGNVFDFFLISGTIIEDMILSEGINGFSYIVDAQLEVTTERILTIPQGEIIKFDDTGEFLINGTLDVNGTEAEPVIFTSLKDDSYGGDWNNDGDATLPTAGDWEGIYLGGYSYNYGVGEFDWSIIRYGGNSSGSAGANIRFARSDSGYFDNSICEFSAQKGITVQECSITIGNSLITDNSDHGIYAYSGGIDIDNCQLNGNAAYAAYITNCDVYSISGNSGEGNTYNLFSISGTVSEDLTLSEPIFGFPICINGTLTLTDENTLSVPAGEIIKFDTGGEFLINGNLDVNGTEAEPVIFTSLKDDSFGGDWNNDGEETLPAAGDWKGIYLGGWYDNNGIGEFDWSVIRYGGANGNAYANLRFDRSDSGYFYNSVSEYSSQQGIYILNTGSQIPIFNSTIAGNESSGIYCNNVNVAIDNCEISDNGNWAADIYNSTINEYHNNTGSGNLYDSFNIYGTLAGNIELSEAICGFPFVISGLTVNAADTLTVPAGEIIKFNGGELLVYGKLDLNGTESEEVVFTSFSDDEYGGDWNNDGDATMPAPGNWHGIRLYGNNANPGIGEFEHARIRYGGYGNYDDANVEFYYSDSGYFYNCVSEYSANNGVYFYQGNTQIPIQNSTIINNSLEGIYCNNGNVSIDNCEIADNGSWAARINNSTINEYHNNTGSGNLYNLFNINGTLAGNMELSEALCGFPFVISNTLQVNAADTLTVPAGEIIKFNGGELLVNGKLDVNGAEGEEVVFTSFSDDEYGGDWNNDGEETSPAPGNWHGIRLNGNNNPGIGEFEHTIVRYGGYGNYTNGNVEFYYSDSGYFYNSVSEYSTSNGVLVTNGNTQIPIQNSTLSGNVMNGVHCRTGNVTIDNCEISDNGSWAANMYNSAINEYQNNSGSGNFYDQFYISGTLVGNMELSEAVSGFPFVISNTLQVNAADTLTVPAGEIIKIQGGGELLVYGKLDVNGTESEEVVFTSFSDDEYGGDWNNDGEETSPAPGNWQGIRLIGNSDNLGIGEFDHCRVRYGGAGNYYDGNVEFYYSDSGYFYNGVSEYSANQGIAPRSCNVQIYGSELSDNILDGIWSYGGIAQIDNCIFNDNQRSAAGFYYSSIVTYTGNSGSGNHYDQFAIYSGSSSGNIELSEALCGMPFRFESSFTVNAGDTLSIPAGEVIKFYPGASMTVNGKIDVDGTEGEEVVFTSFYDDSYGGDWNSDGDETVPSRGDWGQIQVNGSGEFDYCRLRYGGAGNYQNANLKFYNTNSSYFSNGVSEYSANQGIYPHGSTITIEGSLFEHNGLDGVWSRNATTTINNCEFNNNDRWAAAFYDCSIVQQSGNTGSGNLYDCINVRGTTAGNIDFSEWGFPIVILTGLTVRNVDTLYVSGGDVIKIEPDSWITVNGKIDVNGEEGNEAVFTSLSDDEYGGDSNGDGDETTPAPGDWNQIQVNGIGEFDHAIIRYGGSAANALHFYQSDSGYFNHGKVEYSANTGLGTNSCAIAIDNSEFSNNGQWPVYIYNSTIVGYSGNSGSGNLYNAFKIWGTASDGITLSSEDCGFPFWITNNLSVPGDNELTIAEGTLMKFDDGAELYVNGTIQVNGTEEAPVIFTSIHDDEFGGDTNNNGDGTSPAPGDWDGIYVYGASSNTGLAQIDHCRIRYGGNTGGSADNNILFHSCEAGYLHNSISEYSSTNGVAVYNSSPDIKGNTLNDNNSSGIHINGNYSYPDLGSEEQMGLNTFINNNNNGYQVYNNTVNTIYALYNIWGYTSADSIDAHIYDNEEGMEEVLFEPWFTINNQLVLVSEDPFDFGEVYTDETALQPVTVLNYGEEAITISDIYLSGNQRNIFSYAYGELPVVLAPGEESSIYVSFSPDSAWAYTDTLNIINSSINQPEMDVVLMGTGMQPPDNSAPEINLPETFTFAEDEGAVIDFSEFISDVDGDTLVITRSMGYHLYVNIDEYIVNLSAWNNWNGTENIIFTVNDLQDRAMASDTVAVIVTPVNDPPEIDLPETFTYSENDSLVVNFAPYISDVDGDELTLTAAGYQNVFVEINEHVVTFRAAQDWTGSELVTFFVNDGVDRVIASDVVEVIVTPTNEPPMIFLPDSFELAEDEPLQVDFTQYLADPNNDALSLYASGNQYIQVYINQNDLLVTFSPQTNWNGSEIVYFTVDDNQSRDTASDSVLVEVTPVNDPPVINLPYSFNFDEDSDLMVDFSEYVDDVDIVDIEDLVLSASGNENVEVEIAGLDVYFYALPDWNGSEVITFIVNDGVERLTDSDDVQIIVNPVNDAPTIELPESFSFNEDALLIEDFSAYIDDIDGDELEISWNGNTELTINITNMDVYFYAPDDWFGSEQITFTVDDGARTSASDDVLVIVEPVNDAPTIELPESFTFQAGDELCVDFGEYVDDIDSEDLALSVTGEINVQVAITGLNVNFAADETWSGSEILIFTVDDGIERLTASDEVEVIVTPIDFYADFTADNTEVGIGQDVQFTDLSSETAVSWAWDFDNDGTIDSYEQNPVWEYFDVGTYSVSLTVTNEVGRIVATELKEDYIEVIDLESFPRPWEPVYYNNTTVAYCEVRIDGDPADDGDEVGAFVDYECRAVSNVVNSGNIAMVTLNIRGVVVETIQFAVWDQSQDMVCSVSFTTQSNPGGDIGYPPNLLPVHAVTSGYIPLIADFEADLTEVDTGQQIQFTDLSTSNAVTWAWDFQNDGEIDSNEQNPVWSYDEAGVYTVSLTVTDENRETSTEVKEDYITVNEPLFTFDLPENITFNEDESASLDLEQYVTGGNPQNMIAMWSGNNYVSIAATGLILEFSAEPDWNGSEQVIITIDDGSQTESDNILIIVEPVNDLPVIELPEQFTFAEDGILNVDFSDYVDDVDNDPLMLTVMNNTEIAVNIIDLQVEFSASENWYGTETLIFMVDDGMAARPSDLVDVVVTPVNDAPVIELPDSFTFEEDGSLQVDFTQYVDDVDVADIEDLVLTAGGNINIQVMIEGLAVTFSTEDTWNGSEMIIFTVDDGDGRLMDSDNVEVIVTPDPPEADFVADVTTGEAPLQVQFTNLSSDDVISWEWDFDNDSTVDSYLENPLFTYTAAGTYSVALTVSDGFNNPVTETKTNYITVTQPAGSYAANFDGENDYLITTDFDYPAQSDMTLEAWINPDQIMDFQEIIYGINTEDLSTIQFRLNPDGSIIFGENPDWTYVMSQPEAIVPEQWNHVAMMREDGFCTLVINGMPVAYAEVSVAITPEEFYIGGRGSANDRFFGGLIDDVRIWEYARSIEEIQTSMFNELSGQEPGLLAFWNLNEGTGQTAIDLSGNGYDMQLGSTAMADDNDPQWQATEWAYPIPLTAYFSSNTNIGDAPLQVDFFDLSTSVATSWEWDFDNDGIIDSYQQNPSYTYMQPGIYSVNLTISDGNQTASYIREDYITVNENLLPMPQNLNITQQGLATWDAPGGDPEIVELTHDNGYTNWSYFGYNNAANYTCLSRFDATQLAPYYDSYSLTDISITLHSLDYTFLELQVREGGSLYSPGAIVYSADITGEHLTAEVAYNHVMTSPVALQSGNDYYIGFEIHQTSNGYPVGTDAGPMVENYGGWIYTNGAWHQIAELNSSLDYNWCITGTATEQLRLDDNTDFSRRTRESNRSFLGQYNVYLDGDLVANAVSSTEYDLNDGYLIDGQAYTAGVSALYDEGESSLITEEFTYYDVADENALVFDGEDDYVNCGNGASLNLSNSLTIEAWINPAGWGEAVDVGFGRILDKNHYKLFLNNENSGVGYNNHSLCFGLHCGYNSYVVNTPENSINLDHWQHIAVTYNSIGETRVYINGVQQEISGEMPVGQVVDTSLDDLYIGETIGGTRAFDGIIDEVRIWNTARSQEDINADMYASLSGNEPGLVGYWQMNEGVGQVAADLTMFGNDGQLGSTAGIDDQDPLWTETMPPYNILAAQFTAQNTEGEAPLIVMFTDLSYGEPNSWQWDFDNDGTIDSYDQNAFHTYEEPGIYSVSLTVADGEFSDTETKIDYIIVEEPYPLNPPQNPAVDIMSDTDALFTWQQPELPDPGQWLHYDNGNCENGIGLSGGGSFKVAIRWDAGDLAQYNGEEISMIRLYPNSIAASFVLKIWTGANASNEVFSQVVTPAASQWNEFTMDTPYTINGAQELWIGYEVNNHPADAYPAGIDAAPPVIGYGNKITTDGITWNNMSDFGIDGNWNLQAYVAGAARPLPVTRIAPSAKKVFADTQKETLWGCQRASEQVRISRDFTGYEVFLNGELQTETAIADTQFTFTELIPGEEYEAGVVAVYDEGTSEMVTTSFTMPVSLAADFVADTTYTAAGTQIQFSDTSTGNPVSWAWDFQNDGTIDSNEQNPFWTYDEPGVYSVSLAITDNQTNSASELKEDYMVIKPDWTINPPDFEYNGSMWGVVYVEDIIIEHTDGILAAFVGDECRGIASYENGSVVNYLDIPMFNHIAFIPMLYSNQTSGEIVTFQYWDPYIGEIQNVNETIEFIADMVVGDGIEPFEWHTTSAITVSRNIVPGWNWFSLNVAADDMSINNVLASLGNSGNSIKNQVYSSIYYEGMGWFGTLNDISNLSLYKMQANSPAVLEFSGMPIDPSDTVYNLSAGWNWISFAPQETEEINHALGTLEYGLNIKNNVQSSNYYPDMGWFGTLNYLDPLEGYMLKLSGPEELIYPEPENLGRYSAIEPVFCVKETGWSVNPHDYEYNGVIIAEIIPAAGYSAADYLLGIFFADECRGIASYQTGAILDYTEQLGGIFHMPMVYSNELGSEKLDLRLYNTRTGNILLLDTSFDFTADMVIGSWQQPLQIIAPDSDENHLIPESCSLTSYPNPFNPITTISYALDNDGAVLIEVYNVKGQKVKTLVNETKQAGTYTVTWQAANLASGIYLLRYSTCSFKDTQRIMLLK